MYNFLFSLIVVAGKFEYDGVVCNQTCFKAPVRRAQGMNIPCKRRTGRNEHTNFVDGV
jgi:hypothetical protein